MTSSPAAAHPVTAVTDAQQDTPATVEQLRAFRFALDLTPAQTRDLARHAGAARWAFNHALAAKVAAHKTWRGQVDELVAGGVAEAEARRQVKGSDSDQAGHPEGLEPGQGRLPTGLRPGLRQHRAQR